MRATSIHAALRSDDDPATPPLTEQEIEKELDRMGIDVLEPESRKEETMAQALNDFSAFVLEDEKETCQSILNKHLGGSVGELQGGSEEHDIFRVLITDDEGEAASDMLKEFHASRQGKRHANVLTIEKLRQYMLGMCEKRSRKRRCEKYRELGNLMFILAFGPTNGQIRHIDAMVPNIQICLYMSSGCPSTIVYRMDGKEITNSHELVEYWGKSGVVPDLVKTILWEKGETKLGGNRYTKYFAFWDTINNNLKCFGKLYQPVSYALSLQTDPGTALMAGGNEVHAGPPTVGPRMFAFAIGIPEEDDQRIRNEDNDGEVQYCSVRLHIDLCCILFILMEFEYSEREGEHGRAKRFLLDLLLSLVKEYPKANHARGISDDRIELCDWLGKLVEAIDDQAKANVLLQDAIQSESMFYSPDICNSKKRRAKKNKRRNAK